MKAFDSTDYPQAIAEILNESVLMPLGPGRPNRSMRSALQTLTPEAMFQAFPLCDRSMAMACRAALWLYHNFLDDSHAISQEIHTPTGSFWHGIMHRREPDHDNAKYWFQRVGQHPVYPDLAADAREILLQEKAAGFDALGGGRDWDPFAFVDLCKSSDSGEGEHACRLIQQREWQLLFDWCFHKATEPDRS